MLIKLIENTDYKYDSVYRFYGWEHAEDIAPIKDCGYKNIGELYLALLKAWSRETCSAKFRHAWSPENPSVGQCTITAAIVHELFGGEVMGLPLYGGGMHSFNRINGITVDLACEQFGKNALLDFDAAVSTDADSLLQSTDKAERCELLRENLMKLRGTPHNTPAASAGYNVP